MSQEVSTAAVVKPALAPAAAQALDLSGQPGAPGTTPGGQNVLGQTPPVALTPEQIMAMLPNPAGPGQTAQPPLPGQVLPFPGQLPNIPGFPGQQPPPFAGQQLPMPGQQPTPAPLTPFGQPQPTAIPTAEEFAALQQRIAQLEATPAGPSIAERRAKAEAEAAKLEDPVKKAEYLLTFERGLSTAEAAARVLGELRTSQPTFAAFMDVLASEADVMLDPEELRGVAAKLGPQLESVVATRVQQEVQKFYTGLSAQWQGLPWPMTQGQTPDIQHPAVAAYEAAVKLVQQNPTDTGAMQALIAARRAMGG